MNQVFTGNGTGSNGHTQHAKKQAAPAPIVQPPSGKNENFVTFQNAEGDKLRGTLSRVTRHIAVFELYYPGVTPRFSEVLDLFTIVMQSRALYSGRAVVSSVLDAGTRLVCEVMLNAETWADTGSQLLALRGDQIAGEFKLFTREWQNNYKVLPEFKVVVADMQTMLHDLRFWLEQVEMGMRTAPAQVRKELEQDVLKQVGELFVPAFDAVHERYESISEQICRDHRPAHRAYSQRQLHPLTLCSPFAYRAYAKPLGYAGDYEMVNMIAQDPYQGETLFAKIVNLWFLSQWPSKAHRNRLEYLKERLEGETWRVARAKRHARIFDFACGPAIEVQRFLAHFRGSEQAELTLADFNEETLQYLGKATGSIKDRLGLKTSIQFQRKSVNHMIREHLTARQEAERPEYDFIYCAGLFDYLSDNVCRQLMEIFYKWLAPDGLLVVTNVACDKPFRHMLEFVLDWHLIYRDVESGKSIMPESVPEESRRVLNDPTGVNIFIEVRKPRHEQP